MIGKRELVISYLYRYCYATNEAERVKLEIEELETKMGVKSPKFDSTPTGYTGTRDQKLVDYNTRKKELDDELKGKEIEMQRYYNILHLFELDPKDIEFLLLIYKDGYSGEQIAKMMYFTNRQYVKRKRDGLLDKLSKYM